jgi:hypothetical protein
VRSARLVGVRLAVEPRRELLDRRRSRELEVVVLRDREPLADLPKISACFTVSMPRSASSSYVGSSSSTE